MKLYTIDQDTLDKLRKLADQLQGGSDRERDYGYRLWLMLGELVEQESPEPVYSPEAHAKAKFVCLDVPRVSKACLRCGLIGCLCYALSADHAQS